MGKRNTYYECHDPSHTHGTRKIATLCKKKQRNAEIRGKKPSEREPNQLKIEDQDEFIKNEALDDEKHLEYSKYLYLCIVFRTFLELIKEKKSLFWDPEEENFYHQKESEFAKYYFNSDFTSHEPLKFIFYQEFFDELSPQASYGTIKEIIQEMLKDLFYNENLAFEKVVEKRKILRKHVEQTKQLESAHKNIETLKQDIIDLKRQPIEKKKLESISMPFSVLEAQKNLKIAEEKNSVLQRKVSELSKESFYLNKIKSAPYFSLMEIDSVRMMISKKNVHEINYRYRLNCSDTSYEKDSFFTDWFQITDQPFALSIERKFKEKFLAGLNEECFYISKAKKENSVCSNYLWISADRLEKILNKISGLSQIRLLGHGLESYDYLRFLINMERYECHSFDFAVNFLVGQGVVELGNKHYFEFLKYHKKHKIKKLAYYPLFLQNDFGTFSFFRNEKKVKIYSLWAHYLKRSWDRWTFSRSAKVRTFKNKITYLQEFSKKITGAKEKQFPTRIEITTQMERGEQIDAFLQRTYEEICEIEKMKQFQERKLISVEEISEITKQKILEHPIRGANVREMTNENLKNYILILNAFGWSHYSTVKELKQILKVNA